MKPIKLASPSLGAEEIRAATEVLRSGWVVHGPKNKELEQLLSRYLGVAHCVAVNSGASALHLALLACGEPGEVILPSFTMSATANAVVTAGFKPVFADVDPGTGNLDPEDVSRRVTKRTRVLMPVHFAGQVCDMPALMKIARRHRLRVIEDSAETLGGMWNGRQAGVFGDIGCYSFWASKAITTGEGGAVATNDARMAAKMRALSAHGIATSTAERQKLSRPWRRDAILPGYNFRMSHIAAAIGVEQMKKLDALNDARRKNAALLAEELGGIAGVRFMACRPEAFHVHQMFVVRVPARARDALVLSLRSEGIEASVHFDPPVHLQTFYRKTFGLRRLPATEELARTAVTLPLFPRMTPAQIRRVARAVRDGMKRLS